MTEEPPGAPSVPGAARAMVTEQEVEAIGRTLVDAAQPLPARFRALFTLRNLGGRAAVEWISRAFGDSSALLKHELAYCLGQMQDEAAIPVLIRVLEDTAQEPMVRHEAGTAAAPAALGAGEGAGWQLGLGVLSPLYRAPHGGLIQLGCQTLSHVTPHQPPWPHLTGQVGQASPIVFVLFGIVQSTLFPRLPYLGLVSLACVCALEQGKALPEDTAGFFSHRHPDYILIHPSGEALGAIGNPEVLDILKRYSQDPVVEVSFPRGHFLRDQHCWSQRRVPRWPGGWGHRSDICCVLGFSWRCPVLLCSQGCVPVPTGGRDVSAGREEAGVAAEQQGAARQQPVPLCRSCSPR